MNLKSKNFQQTKRLSGHQSLKQKLFAKISIALMGILVGTSVLAFGMPGTPATIIQARAANYTVSAWLDNISPAPVVPGQPITINVNLKSSDPSNADGNLTNLQLLDVFFCYSQDKTQLTGNCLFDKQNNSNVLLKSGLAGDYIVVALGDLTTLQKVLNNDPNIEVNKNAKISSSQIIAPVNLTRVQYQTISSDGYIEASVARDGGDFTGSSLNMPINNGNDSPLDFITTGAIALQTSAGAAQKGTITIQIQPHGFTATDGKPLYTISASIAGGKTSDYTWNFQLAKDTAKPGDLGGSLSSGDPSTGSFELVVDNGPTYHLYATATPKNGGAAINSQAFLVPAPLSQQEGNQAAGIASSSSQGCNDIVCLVQIAITTIAQALRSVILFLFSIIVAPIMQAVLGISPHTPEFVALILPGWVVIRNLMNIVFILILIVISIGTLFNISSLSYKHLLVQLILMALLINFSLAIGQVILGIADTFQAQFLPANGQVLGFLATQLIGPNWANQFSTIFSVGGSASRIIAEIVGLVFAVAAFAVFVAITAYLLIRIVALWILLMVSPIAYAGMVGHFPWHHEATKWWSMFLKYAFFTPIMALFLHLCAVIAQAQNTFVTKDVGAVLISSNAVVQGVAAQGNLTTQFQSFIINILSNVLTIGCLWFTLELAHEFSIAGSKQINGFAEKVVGGIVEHPLEAGKEYALRKRDELASRFNRKGAMGQAAAIALAPGMAWNARQHRIHELNEGAKKLAEASFQAASHRRATGLDTRDDLNFLNSEVKAKMAPFMGLPPEEKLRMAEHMLGNKAEIKDSRALLQSLLESGQFKPFFENAVKDPHIRSKFGLSENAKYNSENVGKVIRAMSLTDENDDAGKHFISTIVQDYGRKNQKPEFMNHATIKDGKYILGTKEVPVQEFGPDFVSVVDRAARQIGMVPPTTMSAQEAMTLRDILVTDPEDRVKMRLRDSMVLGDNNRPTLAGRAMLNMWADNNSQELMKMSGDTLKDVAGSTMLTDGTRVFETQADADKWLAKWADIQDNQPKRILPNLKGAFQVVNTAAKGERRAQEVKKQAVKYVVVGQGNRDEATKEIKNIQSAAQFDEEGNWSNLNVGSINTKQAEISVGTRIQEEKKQNAEQNTAQNNEPTILGPDGRTANSNTEAKPPRSRIEF